MPRLTISVPDKVAQPYRFSLERQIVHFGRGDDNDVHIDSGSVSAEHCVMERIIGGYVLKDLGSTNGIKLDGERVEKISLKNGQDIKIGDVGLDFELSEEEIMALQLEDPTSQLPPLDAPSDDKSTVETKPEIEIKEKSKQQPSPTQQSKPTKKVQPTPKVEPTQEVEPEKQAKLKRATGSNSEGQALPPMPEEKTQPQEKAKPKRRSSAVDDGRYNKLVALLAAIAFLAGIAINFQQSTDKSIFSALIQKVTGAQDSE